MLTTLKRRVNRLLWTRSPRLSLRLRSIQNHRVFEDQDFLRAFTALYASGRAMLSVREVWNIWTYAQVAMEAPGDLAEVGVYRGGIAGLLAHMKGDRTLHLFDTFAGMPDTDPLRDLHERGDFADTSLEDVRRYVGTAGVRYYPGFFPDTTAAHERELTRFAFVHLDVDIYRSTLDGLQFFYPRLSPGGILLTHDYSAQSCPGVETAFTEFFADKPERVLPLWDTQAMIVKQA